MEYFRENGKYSFYAIEKDDIISNNERNQECQEEREDMFYNLYSTDGQEIIEEYCHKDGSCNLYRSIDDKTLEILYEEEYDEKIEGTVINIYTPENAYIAIKEKGSLKSVAVINEKDFKTLANIGRFEFFSNVFARKNTTFLMYNFSNCTDSENEVLLEDFKKRYIKYKAASSFIPAEAIMNDIKRIASSYVLTGNIDKKELSDRYQELLNFQEFCSNSIEALAPMVDNPLTADYNTIFEKVNKNIKNIDKLLDMYLSEELEEKDDKEIEL